MGGVLLSKWKCAKTFRSGKGFSSNSSENSSSSPSLSIESAKIRARRQFEVKTSKKKHKRNEHRGAINEFEGYSTSKRSPAHSPLAPAKFGEGERLSLLLCPRFQDPCCKSGAVGSSIVILDGTEGN